MEDILSPEEKKRFKKKGIALVKPDTPWPLNPKMAKRYEGSVALYTFNKKRVQKKKTKNGGIKYYYGTMPKEKLIAIGKSGINNVMLKMHGLAKEKKLSKKRLIFSVIRDPNKAYLGF